MFPRVLSKKIPKFHEEIYAVLRDTSLKRRAIIAPRGHSKSTLASFIYPMYEICFNNPEEPKFIVIVSESQDQAVNFLSNIKSNLEDNPRIHHYFGNLVGDNWTQDDIVTSNNVRIKAIGSRQKIRGINFRSRRPTHIILDDFESELNSLTPENRNRNKDWVAGAVEPSMDDDGILTAIGTIVHQDSYLSDVQGDKSFRHLFYRALNDNGDPLWPERFPRQRLIEVRESYRARGLIHMYYQEYMNEPRNPEEQAFSKENIQYWDGSVSVQNGESIITIYEGDDAITKPVNVFVGVDLAISSRGDFNVVMPIALDSEGNIYVEDYLRARIEPHMLIDELFKFKFRYAPLMFIIETTAYQQALVSFLRKSQQERRVFFPVREVKPRLAKDIRLMSLEPYFVSKKVFLKPSHAELESELLAFPKGKNDDTLDALHNAITFGSKAMRSTLDIDNRRFGEPAPSWRVL